jgi:3'-5' exoribonuclease
MPKTYYIADLKSGTRMKEIFYISSWNPARTKNGKDYLRLKLMDRTGEVEAVCWDMTAEELADSLEKTYAIVTGSVSTYQDKVQVTVEYMQRCTEGMDPADFMPVGPNSSADLEFEMDELIRSIKRSELRSLVEMILGAPDTRKLFLAAPAGKAMHHAYVGGLLEHTVSVARNCDALCGFYPRIDRDLLIAGALLHDIGKTKEMGWVGPLVEYSEEGNLVGHLFIGAAMIREYAVGIKGLDELTAQLLEHIILSHHGEYLYGSPVLPKCMEAMLLHYADNIDAKMFQMNEAVAASDDRNEAGRFTGWIKSLERPVFRGILSNGYQEE